MFKKIINKIIGRMVEVDQDSTPLKLRKVKMVAEFKIPFTLKTRIEGEFEIKKREKKL